MKALGNPNLSLAVSPAGLLQISGTSISSVASTSAAMNGSVVSPENDDSAKVHPIGLSAVPSIHTAQPRGEEIIPEARNALQSNDPEIKSRGRLKKTLRSKLPRRPAIPQILRPQMMKRRIVRSLHQADTGQPSYSVVRTAKIVVPL